MEKKGLNFLVGLGGLWLLWWLYSAGFLHKVGFLAIDYSLNTQLLTYSSLETFNEPYMNTPLALFATLLIDVVAVFGSLLILFTSGIWDLLMQGGGFFQDMLVSLKAYLETFKKEIPTPLPEPVKDETEIPPEIPLDPVKEINPLEVILLELKSLGEKQEKIAESQAILNDNQSVLKNELEKLKETK